MQGSDGGTTSWQSWTANFKEGIECLEYYFKAQQQKPGEDEHAGVSLIIHPETNDLALVQWTIPGKLGRIADCDENHLIKCIVPVGPKRVPLDLENAQILIPATGAMMIRERRLKRNARADNLNRLPPILVRFMKMWRSSQHEGIDTIGEICFVCGAEGGGSAAPATPADSEFMLCPLCLLCSHKRCCGHLCDQIGQEQMSRSLREAGGSDEAARFASSTIFQSLGKLLLRFKTFFKFCGLRFSMFEATSAVSSS